MVCPPAYTKSATYLEGIPIKMVGFDLVEGQTPFDWTQLTSRAAATIIRHFLSVIFSSDRESKS